MNFLHYEFDLSSNDTIIVTLDKQANVRLLDASNYTAYMNGQKHSYLGGNVKESPYRITPPRSGHWHVVIDLGGYAGTVNASVQVQKG